MTTSYIRINNPVFQQACERILNKECVPFLGSGISIPTVYNGDSTNFEKRRGHTVDGLKENLLESAPPADECIQCRNSFLTCICDGCKEEVRRSNHKNHLTLGELCERFLWQQDNQNISDSLKFLVDKLEIKEFIHLNPTKAHFCLAQLVREGLLPQIFTTNYDTALEIAFIESFGDLWENNKDNRLSVVHDQNTCTHQKPGQQGSGNVLHLYKINGCADAFVQKENYHPQILLTMTQLQTWRDRRWAKDTFRVALRSNTVLFSGFGSDEPQVIHTIHQILDEYSSFSDGGGEVPDIEKLPPNAPVVHSFEPEPPFCQLQIVNNYTQSYYEKYNQDFARQLILTKKDVTANSQDDKLSADDFWFWILQEVQFRLVSNILSKAIDGQLAVSALPKSRFVFQDLQNEWKNNSSTLASMLLSGDQLKPKKGRTLLSKCLSQLLADGATYEPLNSHWNMVAEFIWLLWTTQAKLDSLEILEDPPKGNLLSIHGSKGQPFLILAKRQSQGHYNEGGSTSGACLPAFCLTAKFSSTASILREFRITNENDNSRTVIRAQVFTFADLQQIMTESFIGHGKIDHIQVMREVLSSPSKWRAKLLKTKRQKYSVEAEI